jgi:hypothetical protein
MKKILFFLGAVFSMSGIHAQDSLYKFDLKFISGYNGPEHVPFWIRSNQYGSVPPSGVSMGLIGSVTKEYNSNTQSFTGWGFGLESRLNIGNPLDISIIEGYGKFHLGVFEITGGRKKETFGLSEPVLTSGSFSISGNALGVPKIQIAIQDYYVLPMLGRLFAIKGSYAHGWLGNWHIQGETVPHTPTYLHQKTLYGRFGKTNWRLKLYGGFVHQVVWGNEKEIMGTDYELSTFQTFLYVNTGTAYSHDSIVNTRIGNHLGSIDLGIGYEFKNLSLMIYRQNFYDAGALYYMANILDGLNGVSLTNKLNTKRKLEWKRLLVEFLFTKNQAGEAWSKQTTSPFENYYNNGYYLPGWSYRGMGLGTPFISPRGSISEGFPSDSESFFINNRVIALHLALEGELYGYHVISKFSYSKNYGTYKTSATGKDYGGSVYPSPYGVFPETGQFSVCIDIKKTLKRNLTAGFTTAFDVGKLYDDAFGFMASISKSFK